MAAGGEQTATSRSLQDTPTWALATVCLIFIFLSLLIEHSIHLISHWLKRHRKTALFEAVEKLKSVLMFLGLMSLILAVTQRPISKICIPNNIAYKMLPCRKNGATKTKKALALFENFQFEPERKLAEATSTSSSSSDYCESQGKTSFISQDGIIQLNNFIVVLAIMQIVYSVITMGFGRAKMRRWEAWERESQTVEYQVANDPNRFRYTRQTTFARRHMNYGATTSTILMWIRCFFRQFFNSVAKVDYLTLRHGFISAHLSTNNSTFNFQKYIERSLEEDFKVVVGISPFMWLLVVIFMLVDVHGWHVYLWVSFVPLFIVLVLGTKLEVIVAQMALKLHEKNNVIIGAPLVQPNDDLFWFGHPKYVLTLLHFTLFMNAFELAFFVWVTWQFGIKSCYHERKEIIAIRVVLAVTVQVMCSYITLPLYALVTQMGSNFKKTMLEEDTVKAIRKWHVETKEKRKKHRTSPSEKDNSSSTVEQRNKTVTTSSPDSCHRRAPTFSDQLPQTDFEIVEDQYEEEIFGQNDQIEQVNSLFTMVDTEGQEGELQLK